MRWGIIGGGNITHRFIKGLSYCKEDQLYAVASNTKEKRELFQNKYHVKVYDDYDQLLDDPLIDCVYIATWHSTHYEWSRKALLKGKAVLCEKPATLSSLEMKELAQIAREQQIFFMEAMKTRFIPAIFELKKQLKQGTIGEIISIENRFCYDIPQFADTRYLFDPIQGGILNDVGSYTIASLLDYIHSDIKEIKVKAEYDQGVDVNDHIEILFQDGKKGRMHIAMNENLPSDMIIQGTLGRIECRPFYRPEEFKVYKDNKEFSIKKDYVYDDFYTEIKEVSDCLNKNQYESCYMSLYDSIRCAELTEKIRKEMVRCSKV